MTTVAGPPSHRTTPAPWRHRSYIGYGQAIVAGSAAKKSPISWSSVLDSVELVMVTPASIALRCIS
ncbi:hypothetical protein [Nocardioides sp. TF02-7]|uniref:hypothetical protein n=1 Tax=Nocardioides sp. TF02-7 TaxID=2917724 RepID=UPI001F0580F8|nr:hypothetical protein [Nocardioides sp. TF02-7]UMG91240.1 hypothetical protein MF408_13755 [Nocardioides sp. TF02-7]